MAIEFDCPCGERVAAPDTMAGKKGKCPNCGRKMIIPLPQDGASSDLSASSTSPQVGDQRIECPSCGKKVSTKSKRCKFCGEPLGSSKTSSQKRLREKETSIDHVSQDEKRFNHKVEALPSKEDKEEESYSEEYEEAEPVYTERGGSNLLISTEIFIVTSWFLLLVAQVIIYIISDRHPTELPVKPEIGINLLEEMKKFVREYAEEYKKTNKENQEEVNKVIKNWQNKLEEWALNQKLNYGEVILANVFSNDPPGIDFGKSNITFEGNCYKHSRLNIFKGHMRDHNIVIPVIGFEKTEGEPGKFTLRIFIKNVGK